jgi:hypothetical protein
LLYYCDHADGKQKGRDRIFQEWYESLQIKNIVIKKRIEVKGVLVGGKKTNLYVGYLTSIKNPQRQDVENDFFLFAEDIAISNTKP